MKVYSSTTIPMMLMLMTMSTSFLLSSTGVDAAHSWGLSNNNKEKSSEVEIDAGATKINSDSIHDITHSQKRFVLYNSRRLTGECRKSFIISIHIVLVWFGLFDYIL
jgi:hypothetical protein